MKSPIEKQCKKSFPKFVERTANIPWQERAILLSEAFAFCAICDLYDVDVIIESGIYLGRSTEIWANYFPDKPIYAIDRILREEPKERLKKYNNLTLIEGEGLVILKQLLAKFGSQKIGIFVDGPKGNEVIRFGLQALKRENVRFFSLHDVHKRKNEQVKAVRIFFESLNVPTFFTDEKWFLDAYSKLDKNESRWDKRQGRRWTPFQYVSGDGVPKRMLGSYGPTIGFMFNSKKFQRKIDVVFPKEAEKYINLQCNDKKEIFLHLEETERLEKHLKDLNPKTALDIGSGIGRASVFFFKYFNWTNTLFILADGNSGERQLSGIRTGTTDFYNSLEATKSFCEANGMQEFRAFNLEEENWEDLDTKPDLVYSFLALGFHWPINSFLEEIYPFLEDKCLLIFGLRGKAIARNWISQQIKRIDYSKYQVIELSFEPERKKGNFIILERR